MFYVTTFVKTALSCGLVAGVGDSLYQAVNSRRYSKKTIKFTWDASRSCKVALAGAMAGPVIATPYILVARWTMHRAIATGLGLAFTECFFLPFVWMWKEDYLSSGFKRFLPIIVVGGGATTVLLTSFLAAFTGHFSSFGSLLSLGNLLPEGVVFSIGVGISSFALYGFIFQQGLNAVSDFPREMLPLITSTQTLGMLGVIGLFTCGMFPPSYMPFVNMIGADVLYLTSVLYQCCLTYEYYSLQRYQELSPHEDALKKLRTLINLVTVVSSFLVGPFNATSHTIIASELQISAYGSWMLYFATFYDEFGDLLNGEPAIAEDEELVKPSSKLKRKKGAKITEISDEEEVDAKKKEAGEASEDENCEPNKPDSVTYQGKYGSWALSEEPAFDFTQETTTLDADFFAAFISPAVPQEEEPFKFEEAEETSVPVIEEADLDEETDVQTALPVSPVPAIPAPAPQALPTPVPEPAAKPQVVESQNNLQSALPLTPATKQELPLAPPAPPAPQAAPSSPATAVEQKPIAPREQKQPVNPEPKPLVSPTKASISPVNAMENAAEPLERPIVKLAPASPRAVSDKPQGELQALFPRPVLPAVVTKPKPSTQMPEQLPIPASQQAAPQEKTEQAPTTTVSPVPTAGDTAAVSENSDTSLLPQAEPIKELVNEPAPTDADEAPQSQYMSTVYLPSGKYNASRVQVKTPNKKAGKKRR